MYSTSDRWAQSFSLQMLPNLPKTQFLPDYANSLQARGEYDTVVDKAGDPLEE